jgi:hypothetical protein
MSVSVFPTPTSSNLPIGATSIVFAGIAADGDYQHVGTIPVGNYLAYVVSNTTPYYYAPSTLGATGSQTLTSGVSSFVNINVAETNFAMSVNFSSTNNNITSFILGSVVWDGTSYIGRVSAASTIAVSNNAGYSWTSRSIVFSSTDVTNSSNYQSFAYNAGVTNKYINVTTTSGGSGYISTSTDGVTWTARTAAFAAANQVNGALVINPTVTNKYVFANCSGVGTPIQYSTDGVTWTRIASYTPASGMNGFSATNGTTTEQVYVFGTTASYQVATSTDAVTWTNRTTGLSGGSGAAGIAFGAGVYLVLNTTGSTYATSTDGVTWTVRTFPNNIVPSLHIAFVNGVFVTGYTGYFVTSTDGISWKYRTATTGASNNTSWTGDGTEFLAYRAAIAYYQVPAYFALYSTSGTPAL